MMISNVAVFVLSVTIAKSLASVQLVPQGYGRIRLYADTDYKGLLYFVDLELYDGCINLIYAERHLSSVQTYGSCIALFDEWNCKGRKLIVTRDIPLLSMYNWNDRALSYRGCTPEQAVASHPKPQISLFRDIHFEAVLFTYYDICWCTDLPQFMHNKISSAHTQGNCFRLWDKPECQGRFTQLSPHQSHADIHLAPFTFDDRAKSISVCSDFDSCVRLHGIIGQIQFDLEGVQDTLKSKEPKRVELSPPSMFINSGERPMTRHYVGSRTVKERYRFERVPSLGALHSVHVDKDIRVVLGGNLSLDGDVKEKDTKAKDDSGFMNFVKGIAAQITGQFEPDIPFLKEEEFRRKLRLAFPFQAINGSGSGWKGEWVVHNSKTYRIEEQVIVPKQKSVMLRSYIEIADEVAIPYELDLIIFGWDHSRVMNPVEVERKLLAVGTKFKVEGQLENSYVMAKVRGVLRATFAMRTYTEMDAKAFEKPGGGDDDEGVFGAIGDTAVDVVTGIVG